MPQTCVSQDSGNGLKTNMVFNIGVGVLAFFNVEIFQSVHNGVIHPQNRTKFIILVTCLQIRIIFGHFFNLTTDLLKFL